jgi:hypothetical protein
MLSLNSKNTLALAAAYFLVCGITAIFSSSLWYYAAGISPYPSNLLLGVVGAIMIAIAANLFLSIPNTSSHRAGLIMIFLASLIDCLVVIFYVTTNEIPLINGIGLSIIDLAWCGLSFYALPSKA